MLNLIDGVQEGFFADGELHIKCLLWVDLLTNPDETARILSGKIRVSNCNLSSFTFVARFIFMVKWMFRPVSPCQTAWGGVA
jgi:hypothetical protein